MTLPYNLILAGLGASRSGADGTCSSLRHTFAAISCCFSFFKLRTTSSGIFSVEATMLGGVSASHWVRLTSATRSLLYSSIQMSFSVAEVFSM